MAAIRYRVETLKCDRIVYVTDMGQQDHFHAIFKGSELVGYHNPEKVTPEHMGFGLVLMESVDEDGKKSASKIKSRSGETIKLMELIDEGKIRALAMFKERQAQNLSKV
jgi:arginyl-tRNA synthetase